MKNRKYKDLKENNAIDFYNLVLFLKAEILITILAIY